MHSLCGSGHQGLCAKGRAVHAAPCTRSASFTYEGVTHSLQRHQAKERLGWGIQSGHQSSSSRAEYTLSRHPLRELVAMARPTARTRIGRSIDRAGRGVAWQKSTHFWLSRCAASDHYLAIVIGPA